MRSWHCTYFTTQHSDEKKFICLFHFRPPLPRVTEGGGGAAPLTHFLLTRQAAEKKTGHRTVNCSQAVIEKYNHVAEGRHLEECVCVWGKYREK